MGFSKANAPRRACVGPKPIHSLAAGRYPANTRQARVVEVAIVRPRGAARQEAPTTQNARPFGRAFAGNTYGVVAYLILPSRNSTCLRTTGSYFLSTSLSVLVRAFFLAT